MLSVYVWILQDLDTGAIHAFDAEHIALHNAERLVGNRAFSIVPGEEMLTFYGPGDGSVRVMIRKFPRNEARKIWPELDIAEAD